MPSSSSSLCHASVEATVRTEAAFLVDVVEIIADFLPRGIKLAELPVSPQGVARKLIHWAGRVDASPRITIPIPDAARSIPGLKHLDGHAHAAQTVKEIEAGETGADYDDVEIFDLSHDLYPSESETVPRHPKTVSRRRRPTRDIG